MACSSGVSNFCTVLSDSPSLSRNFAAALSHSLEHLILVRSPALARAASESPVCAINRIEVRTYWLPNLAIEPLEVRRAARALAEVAGNFWREPRIGPAGPSGARVCWIRWLRDQAQEGRLFELHCESLPKRAVKTGSPVVFVKSARTTCHWCSVRAPCA